ncbi:MAG: 5-(carboxyamino)imidazole ribonucleotide synthase [Robiginitomaculum sp.]|nr:5-(carboxyamino)imidazole ribonucleotide synthase [Robiginitomaculum sp.]
MKQVGILGGGQLAMMLAQAAKKLGLTTIVFAPDADCPAAAYTDKFIQAEYENIAAMKSFAGDCDVITFEFENLPVNNLFALQETGQCIFPDPKVLESLQDRLTEKRFLQANSIPLAPFARIDKASDFSKAIEATGLPCVLKTRHFGYDGKGQSWISDAMQTAKAFDLIHHHPAVLEAAIAFELEVSVIGARNSQGEFVAFPVTENLHEDGILRRSHIPANCSSTIAKKAITITHDIASYLNYVGVLAVEFFVQRDGQLLVNEIAPRVHNSGHWTKGGANPDQFEMHLRAITGMDLLEPNCVAEITMVNLIGKDMADAQKWNDDGWDITDYGKGKMSKGRKMGHVVKIGS